jgi:hypothetical protein
MELEPEDGCLWFIGTGDQETLVFTQQGMESLRELISEYIKTPDRSREPKAH